MSRNRKHSKKLKYNKDHPRPQLGEEGEVGDFPRTINKDIPPLVELDREQFPFLLDGSSYYTMGDCSITYQQDYAGHRLSISHPRRYPTWDEVAEARYRLIPNDVYMVMPLPPMEEYLNIHPYMFNLHEVKFKKE